MNDWKTRLYVRAYSILFKRIANTISSFTNDIESAFGAWANRDDITGDWLNDIRRGWNERLNRLYEEKTMDKQKLIKEIRETRDLIKTLLPVPDEETNIAKSYCIKKVFEKLDWIIEEIEKDGGNENLLDLSSTKH